MLESCTPAPEARSAVCSILFPQIRMLRPGFTTIAPPVAVMLLLSIARDEDDPEGFDCGSIPMLMPIFAPVITQSRIVTESPIFVPRIPPLSSHFSITETNSPLVFVPPYGERGREGTGKGRRTS